MAQRKVKNKSAKYVPARVRVTLTPGKLRASGFLVRLEMLALASLPGLVFAAARRRPRVVRLASAFAHLSNSRRWLALAVG